MNRLISILVCLLLLTLLYPTTLSSSNNTTIYVDDDNTEGPWDGTREHPYQYIHNAVNASQSGDTIFVFEGRYFYYPHPEWGPQVSINKASIKLIGEDRDSTIIDGEGRHHHVVSIEADNVSISGFTIKDGSVGIIMDAGHNNITVTENTISSHNNSGIYFGHSSYNSIHHNLIQDVRDGISLHGSSHNVISDNTFLNSGITVLDSYQNTMFNNTVNGEPLLYLEHEVDQSIVHDVGQVILVSCENITVQHQTISDLGPAIMAIRCKHCSFSLNNLSGNRWGIILLYSQENTIYGNTITSNEIGIDISESHHNYVSGNRVRQNEFGILLGELWLPPAGSDENEISRNLITSNTCGMFLFFSDQNRISKNNFLQNTIHAINDESYHSNWNGNYWDRPRILPKLILGGCDWNPRLFPCYIGDKP
jgi:parallel beta-helix repeat protein